MNIFVTDSKGNKRPASHYLSREMLDVMDSTGTKLTLEQLTQMEAQFAAYEFQSVSYPKLFSVSPIASGFDYVAYKQRLVDGRAEFISRNATDFPTTTSGMRPYVTPVIPIGMAYTVNYFEEASLNRFGMSVEQDGPMDCAEFIDQKLDEAAHKGGQNPDGLIIKGIFDYLNGGGQTQIDAGETIYKVTLGTGDAGNTWALKTGSEIYQDIANGIMAVQVNSKLKSVCKVVAMGLTPWQEFNKKLIVDENGSNVLLASVVQRAFPGVAFVPDPYLDLISFDGTPHETWNGSAGSSAVLFLDNSPNNMQFRASTREILRPYETKGFTTKVNTFALTAGLQLKRAYSGAYMKGVA
jgi:hypothetical protein